MQGIANREKVCLMSCNAKNYLRNEDDILVTSCQSKICTKNYSKYLKSIKWFATLDLVMGQNKNPFHS